MTLERIREIEGQYIRLADKTDKLEVVVDVLEKENKKLAKWHLSAEEKAERTLARSLKEQRRSDGLSARQPAGFSKTSPGRSEFPPVWPAGSNSVDLCS